MGCGGTAGEETGEAALAHHHHGAGVILANHHYVTVSSGATLHVVEKYKPSSLLHGRRRAVLMLPPTLATTALWDAEVPGRPEFNALDRAAKEGFISYTLDYEGYGSSSHPADGKVVDTQRTTAEIGDLVRWIRKRWHAPKVDLIGSSFGSAVALILGSTESPIPRRWIGHIVLTANVYKSVTPLAAEALLNPEVKAFMLSIPGGYIATEPAMYGPVLFAVDPDALMYGFDTFPGQYAVGPTLTGFDLPVFPASQGRAPLLQFWGNQDLITTLADAQQFQSEYGGPHSLVVLNGGGHVPAWGPVRDQFWAETFEFLDDRHGEDDECDDE